MSDTVSMQPRYWQHIEPGEVFEAQSVTLSEQMILDFAADFDPQPYHLEHEAADSSIFGGLCASGWQVTALVMRQLMDSLLSQGIAVLGASEVASLRWKKPVYAGDSLHASMVIQGRSDSQSYPLTGEVLGDIKVFNQKNTLVMVLSISVTIELGEATDG